MYEHWENCKKHRLGAFLRLELAFIGKNEPNDNYVVPPGKNQFSILKTKFKKKCKPVNFHLFGTDIDL